MNIITSLVTQQVIVNTKVRGGRDGDFNGYNKIVFWSVGMMVFFMALLFGTVVVDSIYTTKYPAYEVDGVVDQYDYRLSGKTKRVFVGLRQTDSKIRWYNTYVNPSECRMAAYGTHIPVIVSPSYKTITKRWHYSTDLKYNPCR